MGSAVAGWTDAADVWATAADPDRFDGLAADVPVGIFTTLAAAMNGRGSRGVDCWPPFDDVAVLPAAVEFDSFVSLLASSSSEAVAWFGSSQRGAVTGRCEAVLPIVEVLRSDAAADWPDRAEARVVDDVLDEGAPFRNWLRLGAHWSRAASRNGFSGASDACQPAPPSVSSGDAVGGTAAVAGPQQQKLTAVTKRTMQARRNGDSNGFRLQ